MFTLPFALSCMVLILNEIGSDNLFDHAQVLRHRVCSPFRDGVKQTVLSAATGLWTFNITGSLSFTVQPLRENTLEKCEILAILSLWSNILNIVLKVTEP